MKLSNKIDPKLDCEKNPKALKKVALLASDSYQAEDNKKPRRSRYLGATLLVLLIAPVAVMLNGSTAADVQTRIKDLINPTSLAALTYDKEGYFKYDEDKSEAVDEPCFTAIKDYDCDGDEECTFTFYKLGKSRFEKKSEAETYQDHWDKDAEKLEKQEVKVSSGDSICLYSKNFGGSCAGPIISDPFNKKDGGKCGPSGEMKVCGEYDAMVCTCHFPPFTKEGQTANKCFFDAEAEKKKKEEEEKKKAAEKNAKGKKKDEDKDLNSASGLAIRFVALIALIAATMY